MSERQRLITKYVSHLTRPVSANYHLHFLATEHDESARHMIREAIAQIAKETNNSQIMNAMHDVEATPFISPVFWRHTGGKKDRHEDDEDAASNEYSMEHSMHQKIDQGQRGMNQMNQLLLDDALASFERAKRERRGEAFYRQRAEINLVKGEPLEAFRLAVKGGVPEMAFVAAVASGDWETAEGYVQTMIMMISSSQSRTNSVVSMFDALNLVIFVMLATKTCEEAKPLVESVVSGTTYDIGVVAELVSAFVERRFGEFVERLEILKELFLLSIYTIKVAAALLDAVVSNVVRNFVRPFAKISFDDIAGEIRISPQQVIEVLRQKIRSGKVLGKLDRVNGVFVGGDGSIEAREMSEMFEDTVIIRESFETSRWKGDYAAARGNRK